MTENYIPRKWYEQLGFTENPFYPEPIGPTQNDMKGFIDREEERERLRTFVQENSGFNIMISEIGSGKSSFLNLAENLAISYGKIVIKIDPRTCEQPNAFLHCLIDQFEMAIKNHTKFLTDIVTQDIVLIQANMDKIEKDTTFIKNLLYNIFEKIPIIIIMDDLDKFIDTEKFRKFLETNVDILPKNILMITTGDVNPISQSFLTVKLLYQIFDFVNVLNPVSDIAKLKEFVYGRMNAYAYAKDSIIFNDEIFSILLDKTKGNIRETFRYLTDFIKIKEYTSENLIATIKRIDEMKIKVLHESDKNILNILAGNTFDIKDIHSLYKRKYGKASSMKIRLRLDQLNQIGLVFKTREPQSKKIIYTASAVLKEILT